MSICNQCKTEYEEGIIIEFEGFSTFNYCSSKCAFTMMAEELIHGEGMNKSEIDTILEEVRKEES